MKKTIIFLLGLVLTGCVTGKYVPEPEATPTVSHSAFDNAQILEIVPQEVAWDWGSNDFEKISGFGLYHMDLGARFSSAQSDKAILIIVLDGKYTGISQAGLNIDGEIIELTPTRSLTVLSDPSANGETSTKEFSTPLETVTKIINAKTSVLIRVTTPTYSVDGILFDHSETREQKAYDGLKKFMGSLTITNTH